MSAVPVVARRRRSTADRWSRVAEPVGAVLVVVIVLAVVVGPWLLGTDTAGTDFARRLLAPSSEHWFGTDAAGRDVFARVLAGGRISLTSSLVVIVFSVVVGWAVGAVSARFGGVVDSLLMRVTDLGLAFPSLVLALGIAAALGPSLRSAVIGVAVTWWPRYARLVRAMLLETYAKEYVDAAREMGVPPVRMLTRYILPDTRGPLLVQVSSDVASVTLTIAGLSFIGVGAQPPMPEWGAMISDGNSYLTSAWWVSVCPGLAVALTGLGFGLLGDLVQRREEEAIA